MDEQTVTIDAPPFPPPPPPPASDRRWYQLPVSRNEHDKKLGGVISGLSRTFGFDVRTTRVAVAIATIVLPVIAVLYGAAWVLLPARLDEAAALADIARDRRRLPLYIAIAIVLIAGGVGSFGSWFFLGGLPWGLGLIAVGVLLWAAPSLSRNDSNVDTSAGPATPPPPPGGAVPVPPAPAPFRPTPSMPMPTSSDVVSAQSDVTTSLFTGITPATSAEPSADTTDTATTPTTNLWTGTRPLRVADVRTKPRRRPVASIVTLCVLAFIGIASAGDALDWWDIPVLTVLVVSLLSTVVGIVVSAIVNRRWIGLALIGPLLAVTAGLLITLPDLDGGVGERDVRPATVALAERPQQLGAGELRIDLTDVPLDDQVIDVRAEVGMGHLLVIVPQNATVVLDSEVGAGDVTIDGFTVAHGFRNSDQRTLRPIGASAGTINLDVEMGTGRIDIERSL